MCLRKCAFVSEKNLDDIERNVCVTLVIYQESLHDARSTKYKNHDDIWIKMVIRFNFVSLQCDHCNA